MLLQGASHCSLVWWLPLAWALSMMCRADQHRVGALSSGGEPPHLCSLRCPGWLHCPARDACVCMCVFSKATSGSWLTLECQRSQRQGSVLCLAWASCPRYCVTGPDGSSSSSSRLPALFLLWGLQWPPLPADHLQLSIHLLSCIIIDGWRLFCCRTSDGADGVLWCCSLAAITIRSASRGSSEGVIAPPAANVAAPVAVTTAAWQQQWQSPPWQQQQQAASRFQGTAATPAEPPTTPSTAAAAAHAQAPGQPGWWQWSRAKLD